MPLWPIAGVAFLVAGLLEVMFLALSFLGVIVGGAMTVGTVLGELRHEEAFVGPVVLIFYVVWFVATLVAGPIHLVAGVSMIVGKRSRTLLWAAVVASLFPVATVYCAPTSIVAGVLGLIALLVKPPPVETAP